MPDDDVTARLRAIYDAQAAAREHRPAPDWERERRDRFADLLRSEGRRRLLEVGAAAGRDARWFASQGFEVVCTDLSPEMVRRCRAHGLEAHVMDVVDLRFPEASFDAVYAANCLVHVPEAALGAALAGLARVLVAGGLCYLAVYGGRPFEGIWDGDTWEPKRFFAFRTDAALRQAVARRFAVVAFDTVPHGFGGQHFQSLVLRSVATARGAE